MINTVAVSFTVYDENGVIMLSDVVTLKDFLSYFREGIKRTPYEQAQMLLKSSVHISEIQYVRDSVVKDSLLFPTDDSRSIPISEILNYSSDYTPDIFLKTYLFSASECRPVISDWYDDLWRE